MELISKFYWNCIFLCALFSSFETVGQSNANHIKTEILKAEYQIINNSENTNIDSMNYIQANGLIQLQEYNLANTKLSAINLQIMSSQMRNNTLKKLFITDYLQSNYMNAYRSAKALEFYNRGNDLVQKESFKFQIVSLNFLNRWDDALEIFENNKKWFNDSSLILNAYASVPHIKNPEKAQIMSSFIPGLGQVYAGHIGEGILNFTLQASILALTGYGIYSKYYITSYFAGLGSFQKFYFGGSKRAYYLTEQRNLRVSEAFNNRLNKIIIKQ